MLQKSLVDRYVLIIILLDRILCSILETLEDILIPSFDKDSS